MIVYLRCSVDGLTDPVSFFLDIVELCGASADIFKSLLNCLFSHGFNHQFLENYWLGLGTDGASVMLGRKAGLAEKVKEQYPKVLSWHCLNHRFELAVADAVKSCTEINHFKVFMDKLYCVYSISNKNRQAIENCAAAIGVELQKIRNMLDTGTFWVASSFRAVSAVWTNYSALHKHFAEVCTDDRCDSKERATFAGLAKKLSSPSFLLNPGLVH